MASIIAETGIERLINIFWLNTTRLMIAGYTTLMLLPEMPVCQDYARQQVIWFTVIAIAGGDDIVSLSVNCGGIQVDSLPGWRLVGYVTLRSLDALLLALVSLYYEYDI